MNAPNGIADLLHSERGIFAITLLLCATILVVLGKLDGATWIDFAKYLGGALIVSKTVTSAVETYSTKQRRTHRSQQFTPESTKIEEPTP